MIGSYLDKQVTQIKNGVLAAGTLLGIGFIIYFVIKKRAAIGGALGIGAAGKATQVNLDTNKQIEHHPDSSSTDESGEEEELDDEVVEIEADDDDDSDDSSSDASEE